MPDGMTQGAIRLHPLDSTTHRANLELICRHNRRSARYHRKSAAQQTHASNPLGSTPAPQKSARISGSAIAGDGKVF